MLYFIAVISRYNHCWESAAISSHSRCCSHSHCYSRRNLMHYRHRSHISIKGSQMQLLLPQPQPLLQPQPFPSNRSKRIMSQMMLLPHPQSPHPLHPPQLVAAKSLINNPPIKHLQYNNMWQGLFVLLIFL